MFSKYATHSNPARFVVDNHKAGGVGGRRVEIRVKA